MPRTGATRRFASRSQNNSLLFAGATHKVAIGAGTDFAFERTQAFSVSVWIKPTVVNQTATIVGKEKQTGTYRGWNFFIDTSARLNVELVSDFSTSKWIWKSVGTASALKAGRWQHVAMTYDGSSTAAGTKLYIGGVLQTMFTASDTLDATMVDTGILPYIGFTGASFKGNITDVAVYTSELSLTQIENIYYDGVYPASPYAKYAFTDGSGATLTDSSGNGYNGTITGATWTTDTAFKGRTGATRRVSTRNILSSLAFNGSTGGVSMGDNFNKERTDAFSISAWVRPTSYTSSRMVVSKMDSVGTRGYFVRLGTNGAIVFDLRNDNVANKISVTTGVVSNAVPLNKWSFITATYDGSSDVSGVKAYVNGVNVSLTTASNGLTGTIITTDHFCIGSFSSGHVHTFGGDITDVRLHNAVLTPTQAADLYYDNVATSVEAYWPMTDGSGSTLTATTGGVNGTISTATWSTNTPSKRRMTPRQTKSLLNTTSGVTTLGDGTNFAFERTQAFSISMWLKVITNTSTQYFFGKFGSNPGWLLYIGSGGTVYFQLKNTSGTNYLYTQTSTPFPINRWKHFVVTYDGSSTVAGVKFYLDGVLRSQGGGVNNLTATIVDLATIPAISNASFPILGNITDLAVYTSVLSLTQIQDIYYDGVYPAGAYAKYAFSDGAGTTLTDSSGNARNGTISGATWTSDFAY